VAATLTATETVVVVVVATTKTAAAALATATAIATTAIAMAMATAMAANVHLLVRARAFKDDGLWGGDDLSPLVCFLRSALCALCPPLVRVLFQLWTDSATVGRKQFAPAPGKR